MTETTFWSVIQPKLAPYGYLERFEPGIGGRKGVADVNYILLKVEGWVELKFLPEWPKKAVTPVTFPHFEYEQVRWHEARHAAGGRAGVLAQVGREYLFFRPPVLRSLWQGVPAPIFRSLAHCRGSGVFPTRLIIKSLIRADI